MTVPHLCQVAVTDKRMLTFLQRCTQALRNRLSSLVKSVCSRVIVLFVFWIYFCLAGLCTFGLRPNTFTEAGWKTTHCSKSSSSGNHCGPFLKEVSTPQKSIPFNCDFITFFLGIPYFPHYYSICSSLLVAAARKLCMVYFLK